LKTDTSQLVTRNTVEIITENELEKLLQSSREPRAYWGFESSGLMHIGLGLVCGSKIMDMIKAGFHFIIFLADWHSWINNKLGGKMENIRLCGEYFKECFSALGIKPAEYKWASDLTGEGEYWETVLKIAKGASVQRIMRALPIMGREMDTAEIETAWLLYPCMQAADIFHMELDVACAGLEQRKAHMLARDLAERLNQSKPVCVHTPLLMGLKGATTERGQLDEDAGINLRIASKMSKSIPGSCIYVHDSPSEIRAKMIDAYCPPKQVNQNPVLETAHYAIFTNMDAMTVKRPAKYGGEMTFTEYSELEKTYAEGKLHPLDLKNGVAEALTQLLKPVRTHFEAHPESLNKMKALEVTR
jgi:tyrosyl-tRNA synthetase